MAIYLCGDTHGLLDIEKLTDFFEPYAYGDVCSKECDYLIILGDVGVLWDGGEQDAQVQEILDSLPVTVLFLDGNHENFDLLRSYPEALWHGGRVQVVAPNIVHLMRGQVYDIGGLTFFTFGGGSSIDKKLRRAGVDWWDDEMPSDDEYAEGLRSLKAAGNRVDYVLTHTCPREVAQELAQGVMISGEEPLQYYLQDIAKRVSFDEWYFAHWHMDERVGRFTCLYQEIVELPE